MAALDPLQLRAYVTGARLSGVRLGEEVTVRWDTGPDERASRPGVVTWIASSPRPGSREEHLRLRRGENPDGALKIGMPGEVVFSGGEP